MMKKMMAILLALVLVTMASVAFADGNGKLDSFADRLKNAAQKQAGMTAEEAPAEAVPDKSCGVPVLIDDPFYQKVRSSAYLQEDKYSKEANVMIELKNISGRKLYPDDVTITAVNAAGEVLDEETYAYYGPAMVDNDQSLFIWDWFYDIECELSQIDHFEVKFESDTSSYTDYATIEGQAMVMNGIAYALIENTLDHDIYGVDTVICIENAQGDLLDVCKIDTGNASGIFPGSVMVQRANAKDYANDAALMEGNAKAYVTYELD